MGGVVFKKLQNGGKIVEVKVEMGVAHLDRYMLDQRFQKKRTTADTETDKSV